MYEIKDIEKLEKVLLPRLEIYMAMKYENLPSIIGYEIRENVGTVNNMYLKIYSNDHNPPHFHVKSKDKRIDAKFAIKTCELLSGTISPKDIVRIKNYWEFQKNFIEKVWNKRNN